MINHETVNIEKTKQRIINNSLKKKLNSDINEFNTFKYKHFNNFFYNIINDKLTQINQINNSSNKNDNIIHSIINSDYIPKSFNKKLFLNYHANTKNNDKNKSVINNNNSLFKSESKDKINFKNYNNSYFKNQKKILPNISPKYINKGQNTIPNIITNIKGEKPKYKINSRNISFIQKENTDKSIDEDNQQYKTFESNFIFRNKIQQLPKDAVNNLLIFLRKNKKHLARTSKYYNIYKEYKHFIDEKNLENTNVNGSNNKKFDSKNISKGYYGRKPLEGIDIFDITPIYGNQYNNKSEKNRHELIIDELNKLKGYIESNKNEKELIIKDFLNKHNINCDDKNKLISFEKFLKNFNKNKFYNLLKPYLGIKEMLINILEEGEKINIIENNNENAKFNNSLSSQTIKSSKIVDGNNFKSYETNIYNSPDFIIKENINNTEKYNNYKNKNIELLNINSNDDTLNNINNHNIMVNKIKKKKTFDLFDTNSYLKHIEKQTKLHCPIKNYSSNYNLIIEDLGEELGKLSLNIQKKKQQNPIIKKKNKNNLNTNINTNIHNFNTQTTNKSIEDIFITSNKTFSPNNLSGNKKNGEGIKSFSDNEQNFVFNKNNILNGKNKIKIVKKQSKNKYNFSFDKFRRINEKKKTPIIINKLNLKPKLNNIELEDIKKRLKLTEYIVYNNAKRQLLYEELGKNELYECVNNINNKI